MTRHAKNVTAGNVYTSHEKNKDARESGYGTQAIRLGKDSIKVSALLLEPRIPGWSSETCYRIGMPCSPACRTRQLNGVGVSKGIRL